MADKRVIEEPSSTELYSDDWFLKDSATHGTRKILVSRLKELLCGDYIADEWVAGETYTNGAIVSHEGKLYYNKSGGTLVHTTFNSNSWLEVKIDELLEKVICSVGAKWRPVDTYHYDDLVVYGFRLYRCIKNASTQGTWVSNEWIEANAEYYFKKVREYIARYGFVPSREAVSSPYNKGDLILYRAPGDTTNSLYMRLNDTEYGDPTWIPENWLNVGNIGGALSKIYDDMEESSCDVQIKEQSIVDENNVADLTSLAMVGSASEAIATFDDGSDLPMPKLKVAIEPQQDLHGYDAPWVGGAGKNKFDIEGWLNSSGATYTKSGNTYTISAASKLFSTPFTFSDTDVTISASASSYVAGTATYIRIQLLDSNNNVVDELTANQSYQKREGVVASKVRFNWSAGGTFTITEPQIELGSTATSYAPYSNICPISGWDECNVTRCGKNLFDVDGGEQGYINDNGQVVITATSQWCSPFINVKQGKDYVVSLINQASNVGIAYFDNEKNIILPRYDNENTLTKTISIPNGVAYIRIWIRHSAVANAEVIKSVYSPQLEVGTTATEYTPYIDSHTYNIQFKDGDNPLIVYGGTLDVVSGVLTVTDEYIASYNGETLPATWISDRDVYAEGTTPTTGAEVVYELATPTTIQLTPTQVKSLLGVNNVWADTGDVLDAEYIRDATTIINSLIARIEALENQ